MRIISGRPRIERCKTRFYSDSDVKALVRAVEAMERLAEGAELQTVVNKSPQRLITPEEIINTLQEALK